MLRRQEDAREHPLNSRNSSVEAVRDGGDAATWTAILRLREAPRAVPRCERGGRAAIPCERYR